MTSKARLAEADRVSAAFHLALTQIGVGTVQEAMQLWNETRTDKRGAIATGWMDRAVELVMTRRSMSTALARAYYRLVRALLTGTTVADPYHPEPTYITLGVLRDEFAQLIGAPESPQEGRTQEPAANESGTVSQDASDENADAEDDEEDDSTDDDDDRVLVEELEDLRRAEEEADRLAEEEIRTDLEALGPKNLQKKLADIDTSRPADEVDDERDEAHQQAGARQAAAAERIAQNGGRSLIWNQASRDRRAIGYVRMSRTGTPCGWCAMLISRGAVYRSARSAEYADGDKYHDNCHCYAQPIFSREQYESSPAYELNRRYAELWPKVTRGLSGKQAVSAWRRFIRQEQKTAAQEARQ
jgi:hypothetical protein